MELIYHVTTSAWWNKLSMADAYQTEKLGEEGFIHCSTHGQIAGVLERYYANQTGLLLLHVDPSLLKVELKYEVATHGELFPHVYGKINREAIVKIEEITSQ